MLQLFHKTASQITEKRDSACCAICYHTRTRMVTDRMLMSSILYNPKDISKTFSSDNQLAAPTFETSADHYFAHGDDPDEFCFTVEFQSRNLNLRHSARGKK